MGITDRITDRRVASSVLCVVIGLVGTGDASAQCSVSETRKLTADDGEDSDSFGWSVAVDRFLVVGAFLDTLAGNWGTGSVYIYRSRGSGGLGQPAPAPGGTSRGSGALAGGTKIVARDGAANDFFGYSVATSDDTVLVGSPRDEMEQGAAYVFRYDPRSKTWNQEQKLVPSASGPGANAGTSVAIDGDVAVVGVPGSAAGQGAVAVFRHNGTRWVEQQTLTPVNRQAGAEFGSAVDVMGDVVVVGAPYEDLTLPDQGATYVFRFDGSQWQQEALLASGGNHVDTRFGWSVSLGNDALLVGKPKHSVPWPLFQIGAAYVWRYNGTTWQEEQELLATDAEGGDFFGQSVDLIGDFAVIGSPLDDDECPLDWRCNSGSAYVFRFDGIQWQEINKLRASDGSTGAYYGWSVASNGQETLVGAYGDDEVDDGAGAGYLFDARNPVTDLHLSLRIVPTEVHDGDPMTFSTCGGFPGNLAALFVVDIDSNPLFLRLPTLGVFDSEGVWRLTGTLQGGPRRVPITFRTLAIESSGTIASSNDMLVWFNR